jgi:hypothetical protein
MLFFNGDNIKNVNETTSTLIVMKFCNAKFAKNKIFFYYLCSLNSEEEN